MPSNEKPYRVYRGGRIARPLRRVRSAEDVRVGSPADDEVELAADEPPTDEHAERPTSAEVEPLDDYDMEAESPPDPADAIAHDVYAGADGEEHIGYAVLEPPPGPPRPGALPPEQKRPPERRSRRLRRPSKMSERVPERSRLRLGLAWTLGKWAVGIAMLVAVAAVAWGIVGFFVMRSGVNDANQRMDAAALRALSEPPGSALTSSRTILFLGVDTGGLREGAGRADSVVLMRTDPDRHRISLLAIPRDLRVAVPGRGLDKINAAYAAGGAALMIRTIEDVTRIPIHHVALIDFDSFAEVIDAVGGVTIDVPEPIVSNRFDCPHPSDVECQQWPGWRFSRGTQRMNGERALIYSRVRVNRLDASESDITRGSRHQAVIRATADRLVSFGSFARLPFVGRDVARPLTTDLTTSELFELAWVKFRTPSSGVIQCRLGGSPTRIDGVSYIVGTGENADVANMFLGRVEPRAARGAFAPGCPVKDERKASEPER